MLNRARLWLRSVLFRRRLEREMQEEMAEHLERSTERLVARGLAPAEARRQARREFGNVTWLKEEARYARGTRWLDALLADTRFAVRHFARTPATTLIMFLVLTGGMSISTLLFSYVHSYAVRPPLRVPLADDLVRLRGSRDAGVYGRSARPFSEQELRAYRQLTDHFAAVAGWTEGFTAVDAGDAPELRALPANLTFVTENYFSVLDIRPVLGPGFAAVDTLDLAGLHVAVVNHTGWQEVLGGRRDIIGSTVRVHGVPLTIVGVAPENFHGLHGPRHFNLWLPLELRPLLLGEVPAQFRAVGRLRPGVTREEATAATRVVAARFAAAEQEARPASAQEAPVVDPSTEVVRLLSANGDPNFRRDVRMMALSVGLLGLLVLLVACTNVSALLTGMAAARRHEIAIRLSLGAARTRVLRQLLTESALLASAAAAAALALVWAIFRAVSSYVGRFIPMDMSVTWEATLFTFGVAITVGLLFGLSPALHANRLALASASRDSSATIVATRARLQRALVVAQIAFTQPLIVLLAAVLVFLFANYGAFVGTPNADHLITLRVSPPSSHGTGASEENRRELRAAMIRIASRLEDTPGVVGTSVEWGSTPPLGDYTVHPEDQVGSAAPPVVDLHGERAARGHFEMLGITVVRGREFEPGDGAALGSASTEAAVIIPTELARTLWGEADPIGRRLRPTTDTARIAASFRVVGVVDDPVADMRGENDEWQVYFPPDTTVVTGAMLVRTADVASGLLGTVRTVARDEAPGMTSQVRMVAEIEAGHERRYRIITSGIIAAGLIALFLSAIGLYAVVSFSVGQRLREIAVRMAVGARGRQIVGRFLKDGLRLSAVGLAIGLPVSVFALHFLDSQVDDISVALPAVAGLAALGVLTVATAAVWLPARRAAGVEPAVILRRE